jgi:hypothetical protein
VALIGALKKRHRTGGYRPGPDTEEDLEWSFTVTNSPLPRRPTPYPSLG